MTHSLYSRFPFIPLSVLSFQYLWKSQTYHVSSSTLFIGRRQARSETMSVPKARKRTLTSHLLLFRRFLAGRVLCSVRNHAKSTPAACDDSLPCSRSVNTSALFSIRLIKLESRALPPTVARPRTSLCPDSNHEQEHIPSSTATPTSESSTVVLSLLCSLGSSTRLPPPT